MKKNLTFSVKNFIKTRTEKKYITFYQEHKKILKNFGLYIDLRKITSSADKEILVKNAKLIVNLSKKKISVKKQYICF